MLDIEKVIVPPEYFDYVNVFLETSAAELPKHTGINNHFIDLVDDKQPPYDPIYSLEPVEFKTLKIYIETNLANGFIQLSQSPANTPIFFMKNTDGSFQLCFNYWGLNNLTIKNYYLLPLIGESLNRLGHTKRFTQLDLTNTYHQIWIYKRDK